MAGVNKVIILGHLGNDPEVRYTPSNAAVTTLSIATSEKWTDKQTGQPQERTEWHRVVCFNRLGEIAGEYLRKGSKAYIEGQLRTRKWQDKDGQDRYTTEIVARELQLLDPRQDSGGGRQQDQYAPPPNNQQRSNQQSAGRQQSSQHAPGGGPGHQGAHYGGGDPRPPPDYGNFEDDIPF